MELGVLFIERDLSSQGVSLKLLWIIGVYIAMIG